eukprot:196332-Hanusia_phi.AAC.6
MTRSSGAGCPTAPSVASVAPPFAAPGSIASHLRESEIEGAEGDRGSRAEQADSHPAVACSSAATWIGFSWRCSSAWLPPQASTLFALRCSTWDLPRSLCPARHPPSSPLASCSPKPPA